MYKNYINCFFILMTVLGVLSCEKLDMEKQPNTDNVSIFNEYWTILNEKYAMSEAKNVNWQDVREKYSQYVNNTISKDSLSNVLGMMTLLVRDGHTWLTTDAGNMYYVFDPTKGFAVDLNRELVEEKYLGENPKSVSDSMKYTILEQNIGFVVYRDFENEISEKAINSMLTEMKYTKGIIIDVRQNGGGDPDLAGRLASHFTDKKVYTGYEAFKVGPGNNDIARSKVYLTPSSGVKYLKPVAILTDRGVFSATSTLLYLTDPLTNVFTVGAKSGGGSGSTSDGQLSNGWIYSLSVSEFIDVKGRHLDDGVMPDIEAHLNHEVTDRDEIVQRAISEILKKSEF